MSAEEGTGCFLCFRTDNAEGEAIVEDSELAEAIYKHFWFTVEEVKNAWICLNCDTKIKSFHEFYLQVEKDHRFYQQNATVYMGEIKAEESQSSEELENLNADDDEEADGEFTLLLDDDYSTDDGSLNVATPVKTELIESDSGSFVVSDEEILQFCSMSCHLCCMEFANFNDLNNHYRESHNEKAFVMCCNLKFDTVSLLREHIRIHIDPNCFQCLECGKNFCSQRSLRNHKLQMHLSDQDKSFQCEHCPKKFARKHLLNTHILTHDRKNQECEICNSSFQNKGSLRYHIRTVHERANEVICDICAKILKSKGALAVHRAEHFNKTRLKCQECGQWMKNSLSLRRHMKRHEEKAMIIECHICGKRSPNTHALQKHIRDQHTAKRIHQCTMCSKAFKRAIALKEHTATHTGEQLYKCEICGKEFNSSANISVHRKKAHPIEWLEYQRKKPKNGG
ncbi:transcription factor grauzone-like [Uranotaenia lowii]|uniref:transcription factor grauzone-like n=1 Tax=Uranotaenia lowii TaxID=190385 RepID=UPI00247A2E5A|nr:transcription factor grauzone-like [Uranotaenia lowii]XP_055608319.1 transcription factor grauzone-like [Uranotaenia lowii]XP_055608320.1 transcription factor grauzone-like [Uranotaenia lowii]